MIDYIDNMLVSLDSDIDGVKSTHLFNVNPSMKVRHRSTVIMSQKHFFCAISRGLIYRQQWRTWE